MCVKEMCGGMLFIVSLFEDRLNFGRFLFVFVGVDYFELFMVK